MTRHVNYDQIAARYDRRYDGARYNEAARMLRAWIAAAPPGRFLEIGCGTGHWLAELPSATRPALGLDRSAGMLARAASAAPRALLVRGEATRLPYADDCVTSLLCMNALHHFPDKPAFIAEAARVLAHGGAFCSIGLDPHRTPRSWPIYDYFEGTCETDQERYPAHQDVVRWLESAGFTDCGASAAQQIHIRNRAEDNLASPMMQKDGTSQLALLSDEAYAAGVAKIRAAAECAHAEDRTLYLETDLELMATTGRLR